DLHVRRAGAECRARPSGDPTSRSRAGRRGVERAAYVRGARCDRTRAPPPAGEGGGAVEPARGGGPAPGSRARGTPSFARRRRARMAGECLSRGGRLARSPVEGPARGRAAGRPFGARRVLPPVAGARRLVAVGEGGGALRRGAA